MKLEKGTSGIYIIIFITIVVVALVAWYIIGKSRIIKAVPEEGESSERVILVTPKATPTSPFEATDSAEQTEEEAEEPTKTPTATPKVTVKPTNTPTPKPTVKVEQPTATATPTISQ